MLQLTLLEFKLQKLQMLNYDDHPYVTVFLNRVSISPPFLVSVTLFINVSYSSCYIIVFCSHGQNRLLDLSKAKTPLYARNFCYLVLIIKGRSA